MEERKALAFVAIVFALVFGFFLFREKIAEATKPLPPSQTLEVCESEGAVYKGFTNGCMDSCEFARDPNVACAAVLTSGCDCGPGKCWDGFECVAN